MTHYIDKSALVAEIKARISDIEVSQKAGLIKKRDADMKITLFKSILSLLDTLEVKEVDLDKPFEGIKVQTSMESGSLDEVIVTTRYKAQKGEKV